MKLANCSPYLVILKHTSVSAWNTAVPAGTINPVVLACKREHGSSRQLGYGKCHRHKHNRWANLLVVQNTDSGTWTRVRNIGLHIQMCVAHCRHIHMLKCPFSSGPALTLLCIWSQTVHLMTGSQRCQGCYGVWGQEHIIRDSASNLTFFKTPVTSANRT